MLDKVKTAQDILDVPFVVFGVGFTFGGLIGVVQATLSILVALLTAVWLVYRIRKLRREEKESNSS